MLFAICFLIVYPIVKIFYPTKVIGKKNLPKKVGYVLSCNHYSNWDPIIIDINLGKKIRFLAKKELFKNRLMGWFLKRLGAFPVDREKPEVATLKFSLKTIKDKKILGIFPEGTRNKNPESGKFLEIKSGAVTFASRGETFIIPMVIYNKAKVFRKNYINIGEPVKIIGADPKRLTHEEITANTARLEKEMYRLRDEVAEIIENKKRKKHGKEKDE